MNVHSPPPWRKGDQGLAPTEGNPALARVRRLLQSQHDRLIDALDRDDGLKAPMIKHYLAKVRGAMAQPPLAMVLMAGDYGENGWEPAIRDVCWRRP